MLVQPIEFMFLNKEFCHMDEKLYFFHLLESRTRTSDVQK